MQETETKSTSEPLRDDASQPPLPVCDESDETWEERAATLNTEANEPEAACKPMSRFIQEQDMKTFQRWFRNHHSALQYLIIKEFSQSSSLYI